MQLLHLQWAAVSISDCRRFFGPACNTSRYPFVHAPVDIQRNRIYMTHSTLRKNARRHTKKMNYSEIELGPRSASIRAILGYSKALKVVDVPPIGEVALIMN